MRRDKDGGRLKSELDKYLEEPCEDMVEGVHFEILQWWRVNSGKYKVLSAMARDILAAPVTTVASESAFSLGGRIPDHFRSSLSPKTVECLVCLKNWLSKSNQPIKIFYNDFKK